LGIRGARVTEKKARKLARLSGEKCDLSARKQEESRQLNAKQEVIQTPIRTTPPLEQRVCSEIQRELYRDLYRGKTSTIRNR